MTGEQSSLDTIYAGWQEYQNKIIKALTPLTDEQLALRAAPSLRSIGEIASHMVGARARWFHNLLGDGGDDLAGLTKFDRQSSGPHSATELVQALQTTWRSMAEARNRWTPEDWARTYPGEEGDPDIITVHWVVWHLIEHDLHHGGEISLTLSMHGLAAPDI